MAVKNIYSIYAARIDGTTIPVRRVSVDPAIEIAAMGGNGQIHATHVHIRSQVPTLSFTTTDLKAILDKLATPWQYRTITTSVIFYLQAHTASGTRSTSSDFISFTVTAGVVIPRTLTANHPTPGEQVLDVIPVSSDGITNPVTPATGVSDPSLTLSLGDLWTVGPIKVNGASIDANNYTGVQSTVVDSGIQVERFSGSGLVFPSFVSLTSARPSIRCTFSDAKVLTTLGINGAAQGSDASTAFFRKIQPNGARVAAGTATHLSVAMPASSGLITPDEITAVHGQAAGSGLLMTPSYDGTNPILAFSTATAIS